MTKTEERREQKRLDNRVAETIASFLDKQYQAAYPTNGNEEQDVLTAELTIRAAYALIIQQRERIARIKTRIAFARANGLSA